MVTIYPCTGVYRWMQRTNKIVQVKGPASGSATNAVWWCIVIGADVLKGDDVVAKNEKMKVQATKREKEEKRSNAAWEEGVVSGFVEGSIL